MYLRWYCQPLPYTISFRLRQGMLVLQSVDTLSAESWSEQLPISIVNVLNMSPVFSLYTKGAVGCWLTNL